MSSIFSQKVKERQKAMRDEEIPFEQIAKSSYLHQYLQGFLTSLCSDLDVSMQVKLVYLPVPVEAKKKYKGAGIAQLNQQTQTEWLALGRPASDVVMPEDLPVRLSRLDGRQIVINAAHPLIQSYETLENKMFAILGLMFHEVGHLMFMDLEGENACLQELLHGKLPFEERFLEENPYTSPYFLRAIHYEPFGVMFGKIYHDLAGLISDYHDEERLCQTGGLLLRKGILTVREAQYATVRSLDEMLADESMGSFAVLISLLYQYVRYGSVFVLDEEKKENRSLIRFIRRVQKDLDAALAADTVEDKYMAINKIMTKLWPMMHIEPPEHGSESGYAAPENDTEFSYDYDEEKAVFEGDGEGENDSQLEEKEDEDAVAPEGTGNKAHDADNYDEDGGRSGQTSDETPEGGDQEDIMDQAAQGLDEAGAMNFSEQPSSIPEGRPSAHSGSVPGAKTDLQTDFGGSPDPNDIIEPGIRKIKESMIEEMAEESAAEDVMNGALITINNGNAFTSHKGIQPNLFKARASEADRQAYEAIAREYMTFIRKTEREIRKIMQEEAIAKQRRRMMGRAIDTRNLYKLDQRYFMKKKNPEKELDMAIAILVDNSGSMQGKRMESAKRAAILINEVLERLEIPFMIAGHNCQSVPQICFYKMFEDHRSAKYSVNRMHPDGDNRDGLAIDVVTRFLIDRNERDKLFLIISDGQPNASGYTGEPARQDIRRIVRRLRAEEIKTIAFAIGDDKEQIHSIYGEAFVDITDYEQFPRTLSKMIEREIVARL